jgi:hypothetical protein
MFWDGAGASQRYDEQGVCVDRLIEEMKRPVCIEIGAGTAIPSVRSFSQRVVTQHGGTLVRINVREHETDPNIGVGLAVGALDALKAIDELV